jgi:D-alanyl-D-alanine carboxypeptidase
MRLALAALLLIAAPAWAADDRADRIVAAAGFHGVALIGRGDAIAWSKVTIPDVTPDSVWRLASVTKQLTALIVMQEVAKGTLDLDTPIKSYWPEWPAPHADRITARMLLRHQSGLADPAQDKQDKDGVPAFYRHNGPAAAPLAEASGFCAAAPRAAAPAPYHYDNCDFIVLGALPKKLTGQPFETLLHDRIAAPLGLTTLGLFAPDGPPHPHITGIDEHGRPEPALNLGTYGAAGSAYISPAELWRFDRALMENRLLDRIATAEMWRGEPTLGSAALGQWEYKAPIKGCPDPVDIVERRGAIGGVQIRNFLVPAEHVAVILFTDRGGFDYGEAWQGKGFAHDMMAAALCPESI